MANVLPSDPLPDFGYCIPVDAVFSGGIFMAAAPFPNFDYISFRQFAHAVAGAAKSWRRRGFVPITPDTVLSVLRSRAFDKVSRIYARRIIASMTGFITSAQFSPQGVLQNKTVGVKVAPVVADAPVSFIVPHSIVWPTFVRCADPRLIESATGAGTPNRAWGRFEVAFAAIAAVGIFTHAPYSTPSRC